MIHRLNRWTRYIQIGPWAFVFSRINGFYVTRAKDLLELFSC